MNKKRPHNRHLPTSVDFNALRDSLAGGSGPVLNTVVFEGGSSGLEFKKTGFRDIDGSFKAKGFGSYLWSSTSDGLSTTNDFMAFVSDTSAPYILTTGRDAAKGLCVRCLKD